jgi:hypothetical protein
MSFRAKATRRNTPSINLCLLIGSQAPKLGASLFRGTLKSVKYAIEKEEDGRSDKD